MTTTYRINAIDPTVVKQLLDSDDAGHGPRISIDHDGGSPLRCCLSHAQPGERVALVAYEPLRRWAEATGADPGPYLERGPVFIHADGCPGFDGAVYPGARRRVFRRYDRDGHILGGRLVDAEQDHDAVLGEMFADGQTELVHVRAVEFGCFLYEAARA
jgi:uncharacterized protein DUF1203